MLNLKSTCRSTRAGSCVEGGNIRDTDGLRAAFTEQGAGASKMVAARLLDDVARMPGMAGSAADCTSVRTQVKREDMARVLDLPFKQVPCGLDTHPQGQVANVVA